MDGLQQYNTALTLLLCPVFCEVDSHKPGLVTSRGSVAAAWLQAGPKATAGPHYGLASQATGVELEKFSLVQGFARTLN